MSKSDITKDYSFFRKWSLILAESVDAWRVIPRLMIIAYGFLVVNLYEWYKSIPTYVQKSCDPAVLKIFTDSGIKIHEAAQFACHVSGLTGGPSSAQTAFVTTIVGLSSAIFGLYTATGIKWNYYDKFSHKIMSSDTSSAEASTDAETSAEPNTKTTSK